jgi:ribosomal protein L29
MARSVAKGKGKAKAMSREEIEARMASGDEELARMRQKASMYAYFVEKIEEEQQRLARMLLNA